MSVLSSKMGFTGVAAKQPSIKIPIRFNNLQRIRPVKKACYPGYWV